MSKQIIFDTTAREKLLVGVEKITKAVKSTLGPKGRNVVIERKDNPPLFSKDGVTVAKSIQLLDPIENMGAQAIVEASSKTADQAGDGTTTTTILAEAIFKEGLKYLATGYNPIFIKRGIDEAVDAIVEKLKLSSKQTETNEEIKQIATVSANWDNEIGEIIANAINEVGKDGVVTIEESKTSETTLNIVKGMQFDRGYLSPYFINEEETSKCVFENCYILLYERKLNNLAELLPILQAVGKSGKPLLIIAEDIEGEVLSALIINKMRGTLNCCAIKAPGFGDRRFAFLDDIAVSTGGKFIKQDGIDKLEDITLDDLGVAKKIIVSKENATIIEGKGDKDKIQKRIELVRNWYENTENEIEKSKYQERLSKLAGGVAIINIGASTEPELKEKKMRVDDALQATKAAISEGISIGGSVALIRSKEQVWNDTSILKSNNEEIKAGYSIINKAVEMPIKCLCENAGIDSSWVLRTILENNDPYFGYNISSGKFENLIKAGVVDPTKVTRLSLQNAASIASLLLTTSCVVFEENGNNNI